MSDWTNDDSSSSTALGFNVEDIEMSKFQLIPPGRYRVVCTSAKVEPSRNNPSTVLANVEETIAEGEYAGRKIWTRYCVAHADTKTMAMHRERCALMMRTYGVGGGDLAPCVGRECIAAVDVEQAKGEWDARNKIKRREAIASAPMPAPKPATIAAPKPAAKPAPAFLARRAAAPASSDEG
jgi:hypothetical protein